LAPPIWTTSGKRGSDPLPLHPRYNLSMNRSASEVLEDARHLSPSEVNWLIENLLDPGEAAPEAEIEAASTRSIPEPWR